MLKETIYSSLFILASKRNRVRVGYEKDLFCARLLRRAYSPHITCSSLSGTHIPPFPPTRFLLEPPVVGTQKPLFRLRALPQKKSEFAVLASDDSNLEPVEWHPLGARALCAPMTQLFSRNGDGFATF